MIAMTAMAAGVGKCLQAVVMLQLRTTAAVGGSTTSTRRQFRKLSRMITSSAKAGSQSESTLRIIELVWC